MLQADMYSQGLSEVMLGKALKKLNIPRASYVIMTKVHRPVKGIFSNVSNAVLGLIRVRVQLSYAS